MLYNALQVASQTQKFRVQRVQTAFSPGRVDKGYRGSTPTCALSQGRAIQLGAQIRHDGIQTYINSHFMTFYVIFPYYKPCNELFCKLSGSVWSGAHVDWGRKQDASLWLGGQRTATALQLGQRFRLGADEADHFC